MNDERAGTSFQSTDSGFGPYGLLDDGRPFSKKRILFRDCDPFGMLYNVRFLDYVMDTRYDHLMDNYGMDFMERRSSASDGMFVTVSHQTSYREPARVHEDVLVSTSTIFVDARSMVFEGAITSLDGRRLKFHQWTRLRVLDPKSGAAAEISDDKIADLKRTMSRNSVDYPTDYDGRVKIIMDSLRL